MIHLDTSALVGAIAGERPAESRLYELIDRGEQISISSPVLYEWLRGPRRPGELTIQEALFPPETVVAFGPLEAALAADLYRKVRRARLRTVDLVVAACAISHGAALWTLNPKDFRDIPGLVLV
ncbi:MAG TPA: type II toxin-antitoxin system VapC family toxin [Thermodesulfobacteriota bacterium]